MGKLVKANGERVPMVYQIAGDIVKSASGNYVNVHTWSEIQNLFNTEYGFTPPERQKLGISFGNGDGNATGAHVDGFTWQNNNCYAVFDSSVNGSIRISYCYTYFY